LAGAIFAAGYQFMKAFDGNYDFVLRDFRHGCRMMKPTSPAHEKYIRPWFLPGFCIFFFLP
jgi:hypothetical protein